MWLMESMQKQYWKHNDECLRVVGLRCAHADVHVLRQDSDVSLDHLVCVGRLDIYDPNCFQHCGSSTNRQSGWSRLKGPCKALFQMDSTCGLVSGRDTRDCTYGT